MPLVLFNTYIGTLSGASPPSESGPGSNGIKGVPAFSKTPALQRATTLGQSGPGNDCNKGVLCIHQNSRITGTSPSDCLVSYAVHSLGG